MKPRYIHFIQQRNDRWSFPRGHLRWMELAENTLKFGFSSESVIVTGKNLDLLIRDIVTNKTDVIQAIPARSGDPETWAVTGITVQPHGEQKTR